MKKVLFSALVLLALGWVTGCDSNDNESSDEERFVNNWTLTQVRDEQGDQTATFLEGYNSVTVDFNADRTYRLMVDAIGDGEDFTLSGPYTVNESGKLLSLTIEIQGESLSLPLAYAFQNDTTLVLSGSSVLVNALIDTGLQGSVQLTFTAN